MAPQLTTTASVTGVKEALRTLKSVDDALYWSCIKHIKDAAEPLARHVDSYIPGEPPLSGFAYGKGKKSGRLSWNKRKPTVVQYGGRRSRSAKGDGVWPLVRIKVVDGPGSIYDMAGAAGKDNGTHLAANLTNRWGSPSRAVWRVSTEARKDVTRAVVKAIDDVCKQANRQLTIIRGA